LPNSVWLDGDWCWMMNPFDANEYNRQMVIENIGFLLRNFLKNPSFDYVVFNWVIHLEGIYDEVLAQIEGFEFELYKITLMCDSEALRKRIEHDINLGERSPSAISASLGRLEMYQKLNSIKIDTTHMNTTDIVEQICGLTQ